MSAFVSDLSRRGPYGRHLASDVTFTAICTGQEVEGRLEVERFIRRFYQETFDLNTFVKLILVDAESAYVELDLVGTHTGTFKSIGATGKDVAVSCCISCAIRDGQIASLRADLSVDLLLHQIGTGLSESTV